MITTVTALVPVLSRPQNVEPLVESFRASMLHENVEASMLFLASPGDGAEIAELDRLGVWHVVVPWPNGPHDYVLKQLYGIAMTQSDWILLAADDVRFHPGWFRAAVNVHIATGKLVVGTNDMANHLVMAGKHATHPLVHRDYVRRGTIDNPDEVLHRGYCHNSVDVEFCETAIARDEFAFARDSVVEHLHPTFNRQIKRDRTYIQGLQFAVKDRQLFLSRRPLWDPSAPKVSKRARVRYNQKGRVVKARPDPSSYWPER